MFPYLLFIECGIFFCVKFTSGGCSLGRTADTIKMVPQLVKQDMKKLESFYRRGVKFTQIILADLYGFNIEPLQHQSVLCIII